MRPVHGRSPWLDRLAKSRIPAYPTLRGRLEVDVAIIGGGLTGCATAYACAAAGIRVALFEADRVGRGTSGASSGWVTDEPPVSFAALAAAVGRKSARHAFQAWHRAALDLAALVRRLELRCALEARESLLVARTPDELVSLRREQKARREAGLEAPVVTERPASESAGFSVAAALRGRESATVDPYRLALGLAGAAADRGASIFERSAVTRASFTREAAALTLDRGTAVARRVVVATGGPTALFKSLARHFVTRARYAVLTEPIPRALRKTLGARDRLITDSARPPRRISWLDDERLLVGGADGEMVPARVRDRALVQRTGQLMYELSTFYPDISGLQAAYGWDQAVTTTAHGLPVIGPHRNFPHHLFALGVTGYSVTGAYLASRILLRYCRDEAEPADAAFGFAR